MSDDAAQQHHTCCRCLSRRRFLGAMSSVALGALALGSRAKPGFSAADLGQHIDLASLRPQPQVRIRSVLVRRPPPYWLGWPGTAYDLEGHRREYAQAFAKAASDVGVELTQEPEPLETDQAVDAYARRLEASPPQAVLVSLQHLGVWNWADRIASARVPTIIFAPVGTAFTQHLLKISRRPGVHVVSSLEVSGVEQALRMVRAKHQLEATRLLVVRGAETRESVMERLGTTVRYIPRPRLHELFAQMPETDEVRELATRMRAGAQRVVEPSQKDLLNAARAFTTAKRLLHDEGANALTTDCLGMVSSKVVPTPPCMAASLFQDGGVTYGCEADVFAAMSLLLTSYLFDKPGFINDPVPETVKNVLLVAHCSSGTRLNGFSKPSEPYLLRSHSESNIGVSLQVLWRVGQPVTLVRFQNPNELILDTGTVVGNVNTPPAGGCRTDVEVKMDRVHDARDVLWFHQVVFYGDHRRDVEAFCQMYGLRAINSPEHTPVAEQA